MRRILDQDGDPMTDRKPASEFTLAAHQEMFEQLPFEDERDFEEASRGFIAPLPEGHVLKPDGDFVFDPARLDFAKGREQAPPTVNPSLWRQVRLIAEGGLFKVCERIYQVRGYDISNLTVIEGDSGVIVVDPLISAETARAALDLYFEHRPKKPVVAVIHSHSHVDHYGGVRGVVDEADVISGKVKVIAPEGFLEAAVSENVMAGTAMIRRAMYQFGALLAPDDQGTVGTGLGSGVSLGTVTLIQPSDEITEDGQRMVIDGLTFEFMPTPDTEAPAEMHWYIEELKALTAAENCVHTMHNTYPIRGAQVRDPQAWSMYLNETIERWGSQAEVMYGMHHWPSWGRDRIVEMLSKGRDAYRYINDQTLRLANHGQTPIEIAEEVRLPDSLARHWAVRDYYGTISHNVKATYTRYLGWYDGNPANLHPLPPVEVAAKYVDFMGGAEAVTAKARECFEAGEYRWVVEVMKHVVFADPSDQPARDLAADAMEQLGYRAESSTWRNAYLTGAQELRVGSPVMPNMPDTASAETIHALTLEMIFNYLGMRLNGPDAAGREITLNLVFPDTNQTAWLRLENGALSHSVERTAADPDATVTLDRTTLDRIVTAQVTLEDAIASGEVKAEPDAGPLIEVISLLDTLSPWFAVIEP
jgi:alkyl sulfatase BDS1-like metallo-beta-lactamase superfamily hydrolase